MRTPRSRVVAFAIASVIAGAALAVPVPGQKAKEDAFLSGPPFSLNDILQRVGIIADKRLREAISRRGINFSPTKADYDRLKAAGANADLIAVITAKAPPPPPPQAPPKPVMAGPVKLECAPAECDVAVNGQARGRTSSGRIEMAEVPPGDLFIDFRKDGYVGQQVNVALNPGAAVSRSVTLEPTNATRQAQGRQLFSAMVAKLGGPDALKESWLIEAGGSAALFSSGPRTEWNATARVKLPVLASIEISGAGEKWRTSVKGTDSKAEGTGKLKGSPIALDMEKLVRLYRDYQPAALIERLNVMRLSATTTTPDDSGHLHFRAANDTESYRLKLAQDGTPITVTYESNSGLGSGLEVVYSDYATVNKTWYPKSMAIKFSDQAQHGMELHFSDVHFPAGIADREFHY